MLDFIKVSHRDTKSGLEIYPKFIVRSSEDLMIRGSDFYAIWNEETNLWSTDEGVALYLIDKDLQVGLEECKKKFPEYVDRMHATWMWDADNKQIDRFHHYVKNQLRDNDHPLDEKLIFSNVETTRKDYATKKLPYPLEECPTPAWDELISTLYSPSEQHKIEWAIGSVVAGDSKDIQKFLVMYGAPKTGKSTILNVIQELFDGYWTAFDSQALGSANASFALESFKYNPLVAIQHDGDLSRIEINTRLNSLVSHETMTVNEKFKSSYPMRFNSFLIMGTNKPVKITDSKSGIIRRLIDVTPTGKRIPRTKYDDLMAKIKFELGGIAWKCLQVYKENPRIYDDYVPTLMIGASNDFYNFVLDSYDVFKRDDQTTLKAAYAMYKIYCEDARVPYPYPQRTFKEELKSYFYNFTERSEDIGQDGFRITNLYSGFIADKFTMFDTEKKGKKTKAVEEKPESWIKLISMAAGMSLLDKLLGEDKAQYANYKGKPSTIWDDVTTKLKDLESDKLHYVLVNDIHHIVIDFDLKNSLGEKDLNLNLEAASKWPMTYCELSQGGQGLHLHYIYSGDPEKLSRVYDDNIEIKVFTGKSSLRRKLSKCNDIPVATISSGLPLKEENKKKVINFEGFKNDAAIRTYIKRNLLKEYASSTKQSVWFIFDGLNKAYDSGIEYDVSDLQRPIRTFAGLSSNNADYCLKLCEQMRWKSEKLSENFEKYDTDTLVFFDVEVFPNLFVVVYKAQGEGRAPVKLINPSPADISELVKFKLIGFNNRKYDNHILYGRMLGESNLSLYKRSMKLTSKDYGNEGYIPKAFNISYTDIWDFASNKQGLKKWEIDLGIHHQELGLPWDQPVPEEKWDLVADYCINDVLATEAVFNHLKDAFLAREILADLANGTVNDTTNSLSTRLIFGSTKNPQSKFYYRNLAEPVFELTDEMAQFLNKNFPEMMAKRHGEAKSLLPYFPGYEFDLSKPRSERSSYRGHYAGEGGFVWAKPGIYTDVITFDVASMHPHSITSEYLFGPYTDIFNDLMEARIAIKHKDYGRAGKMFGEKLAKYLTVDSNPKALSNALKIVINSVYGLTAQIEKGDYKNAFRDTRNKDNIVAKRGALFMIDLLSAVQEHGGEVIHIKTDSIKVVNPSEKLQNYILNFGKSYGYTFEIEHKFEKIFLANDAVYIAKCAEDDEELPGKWTATGTQFAVPYVFKKLFSKEEIIFEDYCETKSVAGNAAIYLDLNEGLPEGEHNYIFVGRVGQFTPVKEGVGGGELLRYDNGKYSAVTGTKGYRWLESETVRMQELQDSVDKSYYNRLVDDAIEAISKFGDYEWFIN